MQVSKEAQSVHINHVSVRISVKQFSVRHFMIQLYGIHFAYKFLCCYTSKLVSVRHLETLRCSAGINSGGENALLRVPEQTFLVLDGTLTLTASRCSEDLRGRGRMLLRH